MRPFPFAELGFSIPHSMIYSITMLVGGGVGEINLDMGWWGASGGGTEGEVGANDLDRGVATTSIKPGDGPEQVYMVQASRFPTRNIEIRKKLTPKPTRRIISFQKKHIIDIESKQTIKKTT